MYQSYAQNFEDVLLNRLFKDVPSGFYVDVGACHPNFDSVTRLFYDRGWSGLNLDPSSYYQQLLNKHRPRDVNLQLAASSQKGIVEFFEVIGTGYSSVTSDAVQRAASSGAPVRKSTVIADTLSSILDQYAAGKSIDFLKIDVEGHERDVIEGLNLERHRPKVILVEAVHPDTQAPQWDLWENYILQGGYVFAVFDGLNRFYVAREFAAWVPIIQVSPNVFDRFCLPRSHMMVKQREAGFKQLLQRVLPQRVYVWLRNRFHAVRQQI
jgi:FkbM family methyltransferase